MKTVAPLLYLLVNTRPESLTICSIKCFLYFLGADFVSANSNHRHENQPVLRPDNENMRAMCEICSKLTIKTLERYKWDSTVVRGPSLYSRVGEFILLDGIEHTYVIYCSNLLYPSGKYSYHDFTCEYFYHYMKLNFK